MSGDPNVLYDGNHLDVLRRHVHDESMTSSTASARIRGGRK